MAGKIAIYNLGQLGVDVVRSAVHIEDGAFTTAQNAQIDSVQNVGGIRKRDGMTRLNSIALAGAGRGLIGLPLPDRSALTRTFLLPINDGTANTFRTSTDGTTWATATTPSKAVRDANGGIEQATVSFGDYQRLWRGHADRLYYPGNDYTGGTTAPTLHSWDGTNDLTIATIPNNPNDATSPKCITSILPYSPTQLLVAVADLAAAGNNRSRVLLLDLTTGTLEQLGPDTDLTLGFIIAGLLLWQGRIWISSVNANGGIACKTYWTRVGDTTWTLDNSSSTATGYCIGFTIFKGNLYQALGADTPSNGLIRKRTSDGTWSTVHTSDGTGAGNYCGPLIVNLDGSKIFAYRNSVSGGAAPQVRIMESTDGSAWSTSYDISANLSDSYDSSGMPYMDTNGDIYWPLAGGSAAGASGLLKRTNAGTWSIALSGLTNLRGPLGVIYS